MVDSAAADFAVPSVTDDTLPDLRRWWTHGEQELAGLRAMFAGADVGPELDYLDRWHDGQNLVDAGDRVCGVFDFDVAHHGWRLEDIAYAMFCFAREDRASRRIRADAARAFLVPFGLTSANLADLG